MSTSPTAASYVEMAKHASEVIYSRVTKPALRAALIEQGVRLKTAADFAACEQIGQGILMRQIEDGSYFANEKVAAEDASPKDVRFAKTAAADVVLQHALAGLANAEKGLTKEDRKRLNLS